MNNPYSVLIEDGDWYTLGNTCEHITEPFELDDLEKKVARALQYGRILEEQQCLRRGLIFGGIISAVTWVALGVMLANILK
jgi:hypothetical protein